MPWLLRQRHPGDRGGGPARRLRPGNPAPPGFGSVSKAGSGHCWTRGPSALAPFWSMSSSPASSTHRSTARSRSCSAAFSMVQHFNASLILLSAHAEARRRQAGALVGPRFRVTDLDGAVYRRVRGRRNLMPHCFRPFGHLRLRRVSISCCGSCKMSCAARSWRSSVIRRPRSPTASPTSAQPSASPSSPALTASVCRTRSL